MVIGVLTLDLHLPDAQTLKAKRSVLRPLLEGVRRSWNVAVAETEHRDAWQRARLTVATVNTEAVEANRTLDLVADHVRGRHDVVLLDYSIEIL